MKLRCPSCNQVMSIQDTDRKNTVACLGCGAALRVGGASAPAARRSIAKEDEEEVLKLAEEPESPVEAKPRRRKRKREVEEASARRRSSRAPRVTSSVRVLLGLGMVAALVVIVIVLVIRFSVRSDMMAAHEPQLTEYLSLASSVPGPVDGFVKGKLITVDRVANVLDPIFMDLPDKLRASNPEEVGTVVFLKWDRRDTGLVIGRKVGVKIDPASAERLYEYTCSITCVDRKTKQVIAQAKVSSKLNKDRFVVEDRHEWKPKAQVVAYLNGLPSK